MQRLKPVPARYKLPTTPAHHALPLCRHMIIEIVRHSQTNEGKLQINQPPQEAVNDDNDHPVRAPVSFPLAAEAFSFIPEKNSSLCCSIQFSKNTMATTVTTFRKEYAGEETPSRNKVGQRKWQRILLLSVLGYEAAGALAGGSLLIAAPDGRLMDMPVDMMHGAFPDFLIPGIILSALGILTASAFVSVLRRSAGDWVMANLSLGGLAIWFWVEIAILLDLHWLHAMWGLPVVAGWLVAITLVPSESLRKALLVCGILSSLLYVAVNIIVPMQWEGYSVVSRTPSELSAIGAPTRTLWSVLATPYTFLIMAFAWGVWKSAGDSRHLRIAAGLLMVYGALGFLWPFAPMHSREVLAAGGGTFSDTMHIALGAATVILYLLALGFASAALGRPFRIYCIASLVLVLVFGALTFLEAPGVSRNEPTPLIGVWERINIGVFLVWVAVLAIMLLPGKKCSINK